VVLAALEKAVVAWNGSDFFKVATSATDGVSTFSAGSTGLTPSSATAGAVTLAGTLAVANGGTGITSFGTGVATALGVNTGSAGAFVVNGGALGTPASGTVTNLTGTASININGTVGATTANTGAFTTVSATNPSESLTLRSGNTTRSYLTIGRTAYEAGIGVAGSNLLLGTGDVAGDLDIFTNTATGKINFSAGNTGAIHASLSTTGLNSTVIGATTPAAGSFTTLSATGNLTLGYDASPTIQPILNATSGNAANFVYKTAGVSKWGVGRGSNGGGDDYMIYNYALSSNAVVISSSTGAVSVTGALSATGTVGVGTTGTVATWGSSPTGVLQIGGSTVATYGGEIEVSLNAYYNAGWKYIANGFASQHLQTSGQHYWYTAGNNVSGAGAAISDFASPKMTLSSTGLAVTGTLSATGLSTLGGVSNTGATIHGQLTINNQDAPSIVSTTGGTPTGVSYWTHSSGGAAKAYIGTENSTGGGIIGTGSAYALILGTATNVPTYIFSNNAVVGAFSSTGLAVTGTLSATGAISSGSGSTTSAGFTAGYYGFSGYFALWPTAVTADATNYSLNGNSTTTALNATSATQLRVNNTVVVQATASGAAVTGLLDLSAATAGQIKFPATQNASADANTLDDYDQYTAASAACTGAITTAAVWKLTKVGNVVTLTLPAVEGTVSTSAEINFGTAIPTKYRPATSLVIGAACIKDNGASVAAIGTIGIGQTNGVITIYRDGLAGVTNWTNGAVGGLNFPVAVSWTI
jgi:hypothetical protein